MWNILSQNPCYLNREDILHLAHQMRYLLINCSSIRYRRTNLIYNVYPFGIRQKPYFRRTVISCQLIKQYLQLTIHKVSYLLLTYQFFSMKTNLPLYNPLLGVLRTGYSCHAAIRVKTGHSSWAYADAILTSSGKSGLVKLGSGRLPSGQSLDQFVVASLNNNTTFKPLSAHELGLEKNFINVPLILARKIIETGIMIGWCEGHTSSKPLTFPRDAAITKLYVDATTSYYNSSYELLHSTYQVNPAEFSEQTDKLLATLQGNYDINSVRDILDNFDF